MMRPKGGIAAGLLVGLTVAVGSVYAECSAPVGTFWVLETEVVGPPKLDLTLRIEKDSVSSVSYSLEIRDSSQALICTTPIQYTGSPGIGSLNEMTGQILITDIEHGVFFEGVCSFDSSVNPATYEIRDGSLTLRDACGESGGNGAPPTPGSGFSTAPGQPLIFGPTVAGPPGGQPGETRPAPPTDRFVGTSGNKPEAEVVGIEVDLNPSVIDLGERDFDDAASVREVFLIGRLLFSNDNVPEEIRFSKDQAMQRWEFALPDGNGSWVTVTPDSAEFRAQTYLQFSGWMDIPTIKHLRQSGIIPATTDEQWDRWEPIGGAARFLLGGGQMTGDIAQIRSRNVPIRLTYHTNPGQPDDKTFSKEVRFQVRREPGLDSTAANKTPPRRKVKFRKTGR